MTAGAHGRAAPAVLLPWPLRRRSDESPACTLTTPTDTRKSTPRRRARASARAGSVSSLAAVPLPKDEFDEIFVRLRPEASYGNRARLTDSTRSDSYA